MELDLVLQYLAVAGLIAAVSSIAVFCLLKLCSGFLASCNSVTRARLLLSAALLPFLLTLSLVGAALAPALGWIADHCSEAYVLHLHPHICGHVTVAATPGLVALMALLFGSRLVWSLGRACQRQFRSAFSQRRLFRSSEPLRGTCVRLIAMAAPRAFVVGVFRPRVYISHGLWQTKDRQHLRSVLAHERAHLQRRDPMRRMAVAWLSCCHLPVIAGYVAHELAIAHEHAADERAAVQLGSRLRVAEALVCLARSKSASVQAACTPVGAFAFGGEAVIARVEALLADAHGRHQPNQLVVLACAGLALALIAMGAGGVLHAFEQILGVLNRLA